MRHHRFLPARAGIRGNLTRRAIAGIAAIAASATALASLSVPAAAAQDDPALATFYGQSVAWEACEGRSPRVQCASVTVPLDYSDPQGRTIELALLRVPATGTPRGSLLVNPGGPGAGGLDFAEYIGSVVDPDVRAAYDIVGFDPRGVGASAPVECMTGKQTTRWFRTDSTPSTAKQRKDLWSQAAAISRGCLASDPILAKNIGTDRTVADMDVLRATLGDDRLNWLGFSYGTSLGALYAEQFPERVGRMVLDGAVDPSLDGMQVSKDQSEGFQRAIGRFAADCATRSTCVAPTSTRVIRFINTLLKDLDRTTLPTDGSRRLVQAEAITALFFSMYSTDLWPTLRQGLREAKRGDGTTLQLLAQLANDQTGPDTYGSNFASAFYAIACWDYPPTPGIAGLQAAAGEWSASARVPEMAEAMSWGNAPCSTWFGHTDKAPSPVTSTTSAPILIVGTTFDPATPYSWSRSLSRQLPSSRLLTHRGDGHTAYGGLSLCVDDTVDAFLLTGALPEPGTTCTS